MEATMSTKNERTKVQRPKHEHPVKRAHAADVTVTAEPVRAAYAAAAPDPEPMSETPLLLPDGRDARLLGFHELWAAVSPLVPGLDQAVGKDGVLAAYERRLWAGLAAKMTPAERSLLGR